MKLNSGNKIALVACVPGTHSHKSTILAIVLVFSFRARVAEVSPLPRLCAPGLSVQFGRGGVKGVIVGEEPRKTLPMSSCVVKNARLFMILFVRNFWKVFFFPNFLSVRNSV